MRIPRVFTTEQLDVGGLIELDKGPARHLTSVLRMNAGQAFILFNGQGGEFSAELVQAKKDRATAKITGFTGADRESPLQLHLCLN